MTKISIVYPTYRPGSFDILLDSLKRQTFDDFELIIVDDYPTDRSDLVKPIFEDEGIDVKFFGRSKEKCIKNTGYNLMNAWNTGVMASIGEICLMICDYLWIPPEGLQKFIDGFDKLGDRCCISGIGRYWDHKEGLEIDLSNEQFSVFKDEWNGSPADNGWTHPSDWIPEKFELFYAAVPYDLFVETNGFQECYDATSNLVIDPFIQQVEDVGWDLHVDKNNRCELIEHRNWKPSDVWHISKKRAITATTFRWQKNCFDLQTHKRGIVVSADKPTNTITIDIAEPILEVGGGGQPLYRPNMDVREMDTVDIVSNLEESFPIEDESYETVFGHYVIEHLSWRKVRQFVSECHRILNPGGKCVQITANTLEQCREIIEEDAWTDETSSLLFGGQDYPDNTHKNALSPRYAITMFEECGFQEVSIHPHPISNTDMIIEAIKSSAVVRIG